MLRFKPQTILAKLRGTGGGAGTTDNTETERQDDTVRSLGVLTVVLAFISTFLNAVSGILDKYLMSTGDITDGQLQFWYLLFMVVYYGLYVIATKTKITAGVWKNPYVWLIAVLFMIADRCLFIANGMEGSRVTVMTLLKQICCVVTIIGGKIVFKEKNIGYRLICAAVVILGIVLAAVK